MKYGVIIIACIELFFYEFFYHCGATKGGESILSYTVSTYNGPKYLETSLV